MAELIKKKVSAATLVEVIVAMVIIMIVFTIGLGIYSNIIDSGFSLRREQMQQQMQKIIRETQENKEWEDRTIKINDIRYRRKVQVYEDYSDVYLISVEAVENGRAVAKVRQLVKFDTDEN